MDLPVVNHEDYFAKIGDDHKFPINKFGELANYLIQNKIVKKFHRPYACSFETLSYAHSQNYISNIKNAGFKTEISYFHPKTKFFESNGALSLSTTFDYSFKKGTYINTSVLYNSSGISQPLNSSNLFQTFIGDISAKSLMPSKWTYFGQVSGALNPALNGSFAVFYMQGINLALFMPSIVYNINDDWELMLTAQSAFGELNTKFQSMGSGIFLRTMYSF